MSEPNRYHLEMHKSNDGDWVLYEEYARLKAEVERLTKAGDALANNIVWVELYRPLVAKWNAAKEGKGHE